MEFKFKDGSVFQISDDSQPDSIVIYSGNIDNVVAFVKKCTDENLSYYLIDNVPYMYFQFSSMSWHGEYGVIFLTKLSDVEILKPSIDVSDVTDEQAIAVPTLFDEWSVGVSYNVGDRVRWKAGLKKCLQAHTSTTEWIPDVASLWADVLIPDPSVIPEWVQPGSTNPYMKGDKVRHNGKTWVSDIDNNVWEPGVYGWSEVSE